MIKNAEKANKVATGQGKVRENLKFAKTQKFDAIGLIRNYRMTNINLIQ